MKTNTTVTQVWQNEKTMGQNALRYHFNGKQHVVSHIMHAGEDICPNIFRFATIEEARNEWRRLLAIITARGYTTLVK